MVKGKTIKVFLTLGVLLFSLVGIFGCSNDEKPNTQESIKNSNSLDDDSDHRTGPVPIHGRSCWDFASFHDYFKDINMNNYSLVSFDLDNVRSIEKTYYEYETNQPRNSSFFDPENYSNAFTYKFYSVHDLIGSGIDNISYSIKCASILPMKNMAGDDFVFELVNQEDTTFIYDLLLNDERVMKIEINMEEGYSSKDIEDVVLLLENNIAIIGG
ncbi:MAG: hypothetical protein IJ308_02250 [Clostridia bacterium]|nr:hypothetical protein [Clostridia bacterium]